MIDNFYVQCLTDCSRFLRNNCNHYFFSSLECDPNRNEFTVAFVGEFNSGKSSILNMLATKPLLPTGRFPETGVCCRLERGVNSETRAMRRGLCQIIDGDVEKLRRVTALTANGERVCYEELPDEIHIQTPDLLTPSGVILIDTPGFNDDGQMTAKAIEVAKHADLVVWILNSRQFLSLIDQRLLREVMQYRGPYGYLFVENMFLNSSNPSDLAAEWQSRLKTEFGVHSRKLTDFINEVGLKDVRVLCLSAKAAEIDLEFFGVRDLLQYISTLSAGEKEGLRIRRQAAMQLYFLTKLLSKLREELDAELAVLKRSETSWAEYVAHAANQKALRGQVLDAIANTVQVWRHNAGAIGHRVASTINSDSLQRDGTYFEGLRASFSALSEECARALRKKIEDISAIYNENLDASPQASDLEKIFLVQVPKFDIPNNGGVGEAVAAGAAAGAAFGSVFPVIGTFAGAFVGGVAGLFGGAADAMGRDVVGTKENVENAAKAAIDHFNTRERVIVGEVMNLIQLVALSEPPKPCTDSVNLIQGRIGLAEQHVKNLRKVLL
ncbi:dynamin family protein [Rhodomicrobium sp. Az07]|uniref:dynamin family protein n=1 Tax=Rhodomicrobium sp. Az07 TaxID=2839034 RepID=UPI001BE6781E|nr:dynamin family protein [Rhodomicrobium sp. Az07]MBT3072042.1 dynamin family protein [Rhodomicrobium sp. Az07]